jgi:hypothetical protein
LKYKPYSLNYQINCNFIKISGFSFHAPWLNGHPIDAPEKIDMIDWYSQTIGYYEEAAEHESRNSAVRLLRTHGDILYNDEFRVELTVDDDKSSTEGRVSRVFRAIDMVRRYKAIYEDGADLSTSIVRDFAIVWKDNEGSELPRELMHNHRQIYEEIEKRSDDNCPVRAFGWHKKTRDRNGFMTDIEKIFNRISQAS